MIQPGVYNIALQRRADYSVLLEFKDSERVAIDLTGWQVFAQVWDLSRSSKLADFSVDYVDRIAGRVKLRLTYEETTNFPAQAVYDVMLINANGEREYYLEGAITVSESYTSVP